MTTLHTRTRQRGAVLIISLLFLVILTMLGLTAMSGATFEERMAGNSRDTALAFQAAEAALRDARAQAIPLAGVKRDLSVPAVFVAAVDNNGNCDKGVCQSRLTVPKPLPKGGSLPDIPVNVDWARNSTTSAKYGEFTGAPDLSGNLSAQPRYTIELFCTWLYNTDIGNPASPCRVYRFTARGFGRNPNTQVTLQEIFYKEAL